MVFSSFVAVAESSADDGVITMACAPSLTRRSFAPTSERNDASASVAAASWPTVTFARFGWIGTSVVVSGEPSELMSLGTLK